MNEEKYTPDSLDTLDKDQKDAEEERGYIGNLLEKYPPEKRTLLHNTDGIECVFLGSGEIPLQLAQSISSAKKVLRRVFGENFGKVFEGLKVYYVRSEGLGGGMAHSWANAITMDPDNNALTIAKAEEILGPAGAGILELGDWSRITSPDTISGKTTLIHEVGHILQAKTRSKMANHDDAPTKYGRSNKPNGENWEDYPESFLYFCMGHRDLLKGNRAAIIERDILRVTAESEKVQAII